MNRRALNVGLLYCALVIIFKLTILLGGYTLGTFGFYYSQIVSVLLIIPFFFIAIYQVREKELGGFISGKEAMRIALTVLAVGAVVLSIYNVIQFNWKYKDISVQYYNSEEYIKILTKQREKYPDKVPADFQRIIKEQIASLSAFQDTTAKLFPMIFVGLSGAFVAAVFMKRRPTSRAN